jgi:nicotinamide-nucleotide amidase
MTTKQKTETLVGQLALALQNTNSTLVAAESCTGGLIAKLCTDVAGSSAWFEGGVVSYSNEIKQSVLKVNKKTLKLLGAVSEQTAKEMALGAVLLTPIKNTRYAVSITGVAGPGGGTLEKPVGTVCFAWSKASTTTDAEIIKTETKLFAGNRKEIREQSALFALQVLRKLLKIQ